MQTTWRAPCASHAWPTALRFFSCWQVSSHGRICNSRGVISHGCLTPSGYMSVQISGQQFRVHRIVKIAFHGLPRRKEAWQVHHVDGDRANNQLDNLEYSTRSENIRHTYSNPKRRSSGPARSKLVLCRPIGSMSWTTVPSVTAAAKQLGMSRDTVSRCCRNQSATKGLEFKYPCPSDLALSGEEWRPVVHPMSGNLVPGRMVSSLGRIASCTGLIGRGHMSKQGYYTTSLRINSHRWSVLVHRLVAAAFLEPPLSVDQCFVNHKDLDKGNNAVENLEWVSPAENLAHFHASSTLGRGTAAKPVWSRPHGMENHAWSWHHSMASAARELGIDQSAISKSMRGLQRRTGGFEFRLAATPEIVSSLPGEEWRDIDECLLRRDREIRGLR